MLAALVFIQRAQVEQRVGAEIIGLGGERSCLLRRCEARGEEQRGEGCEMREVFHGKKTKKRPESDTGNGVE